ncbi:polysaccharide deacetylase family protein [Streptomyces hoynatensis]|uniref:polysaccharide deacetylase family protein n=1 Tax=Streptomyces hoynatensis TaxID=1141874 RepID=UPI001F4D4959|nr:polysaccharide deacetylase family protein [Streptomyces hoynatensis]
MKRRLLRGAALGGATILALICSGAGLPAFLRPAAPEGESDASARLPSAAAPAPGGPELGGGLPFGAPQRAQALGLADALAGYARNLKHAEALRVAAAKSWGLPRVPLRAPTPPRRKPGLVSEPGHLTGKGLPPVLVQVPTEEKVVFLTIDDGAEKDPELLRMLRELDVPFTGFLSDEVARADYGYFRKAHREGAGMQNHTVNHRELTALSYAEQRAEICRQQDNLEREIGERPTLFRPPYGAYNRDTLRAAASCGIEVVPLWAEEAFPDRIDWGRGDRRLHPGDIILTHFRGEAEWQASMPDMVRRLLRTVTEQGFAVARLEDYV